MPFVRSSRDGPGKWATNSNDNGSYSLKCLQIKVCSVRYIMDAEYFLRGYRLAAYVSQRTDNQSRDAHSATTRGRRFKDTASQV
jgi:hypothetical protein